MRFRLPLLLFFLVLISSYQCIASEYYNEPYRPQYHFTPEKNWTNDPNGCVFYEGEFHLFYQHNPFENKWGFMHWGHAISNDLVHWKHFPIALYPDENSKDNAKCTEFSGSAVVDTNNTSGFQTGQEKVLVAIYTSWQCGQRIAYSNDKGRTWVKYDKNPVIALSADDARDPKVFWHDPSKQWVMVLYRRPDNDEKKNGISIYTSSNLKEWQYQSHVLGFFECPDLFELPVDNDPANKKWVLHGADGKYMTGTFDGKKFTPETEKLAMDYGANFYAAQSWSDVPDGRRIQIGWMSGGVYPDSLWNQQMSFPCELTLRKTEQGIRVCRKPVEELESLVAKTESLGKKVIKPGENILSGLSGSALRISGTFEIKEASELKIIVRKGKDSDGTPIVYNKSKQEITVLGKTAPLKLQDGKISLDILLDRASIELFGNDGLVSMSSCFVPKIGNEDLELSAQGGDVVCSELKVKTLRSAWSK